MQQSETAVLGLLLEAIRNAPFGTESVPDVPDIDRSETMRLMEILLEKGWVEADHLNQGEGRLVSVWNPRITMSGEHALEKMRFKSLHSSSRPVSNKALEEKRRMRLDFMRLLYEVTGGSPGVDVAARDLGQQLCWDEDGTDLVVEYLLNEALLEMLAFGPVVAITHRGVVEVEQALQNPDGPTEHFAPINIINMGSMHGFQIQQGGTDNRQSNDLGSENVAEMVGLIAEFRALLGRINLGEDDSSETEAELDTAERQLQSSRPKWRAIRDNLQRVAQIFSEASTTAENTEKLIGILNRLHQLLPGI